MGPGSLEIVMNGYLIWVVLFAANVALLVLWVHYIIRVLFGKCPHCGERRKPSVFQYLASIALRPTDKGHGPLPDQQQKSA